jgi:hypothetical protein
MGISKKTATGSSLTNTACVALSISVGTLIHAHHTAVVGDAVELVVILNARLVDSNLRALRTHAAHDHHLPQTVLVSRAFHHIHLLQRLDWTL